MFLLFLLFIILYYIIYFWTKKRKKISCDVNGISSTDFDKIALQLNYWRDWAFGPSQFPGQGQYIGGAIEIGLTLYLYQLQIWGYIIFQVLGTRNKQFQFFLMSLAFLGPFSPHFNPPFFQGSGARSPSLHPVSIFHNPHKMNE